MNDAIHLLADLSALVFVLSSMLSLGLSLTVREILDPLRNPRFVWRMLLANFVLVPLVAYLLGVAIPLDPSLVIGLILLAVPAGAPFLPKLVQISKGNVPLSVGLMVLLMIVTVVYVPMVLPLMLPGVTVEPMAIARSLILLMLLPLAIGLVVHARYGSIASAINPYVAQASSTSLVILVVLIVVVNIQYLLDTIGTGAILAATILIAASLAIGYWLGGPAKDSRIVSALGAAQRNNAASMVIAIGSFGDDPKVLTMIVVGSLLMLVILMVFAAEAGKRSPARSTA
jgi:predicted Na+-dependent transporter